MKGQTKEIIQIIMYNTYVYSSFNNTKGFIIANMRMLQMDKLLIMEVKLPYRYSCTSVGWSVSLVDKGQGSYTFNATIGTLVVYVIVTI